MKTFEELQNAWNSNDQEINETFLNQLQGTIKKINAKKRITMLVLAITAIILLIYLFWIGKDAPLLFIVGLGIMITSLFIRIVLEQLSIHKLSKIPKDHSFYTHQDRLKSYYTSRLVIHQWITPLILIAYWIGFVLLLPALKENLSTFWFNYVWISSIPIAIVMVLFIAHHIKKERKTLEQLQEEVSN